MVAVSRAARNMLIIGGGAIAFFLRQAEQQLAAEAKLEAVLKATGQGAYTPAVIVTSTNFPLASLR